LDLERGATDVGHADLPRLPFEEWTPAEVDGARIHSRDAVGGVGARAVGAGTRQQRDQHPRDPPCPNPQPHRPSRSPTRASCRRPPTPAPPPPTSPQAHPDRITRAAPEAGGENETARLPRGWGATPGWRRGTLG